MHHQAWLEIHQRRERVSHYVDVSVHDVRPEFLEYPVQTIVGARVKSWSFAEKPGSQAGLIELLFQIRSEPPAIGNDCGLKALAIQTEDDVNGHAFGSAGTEVCENVKNTIFHDSH